MLTKTRSLYSLAFNTKFLFPKALIKPLVPSSFSNNKLFHKPHRQFSEDNYLRDFSDYSLAQRVLKNYVSSKSILPRDMIAVLNELEKFKMGLVSSESIYRDFIIQLNKGLKNKLRPQEIDSIAEKASNIRVKDVKFWKSVHGAIKASKDNIDIPSWISISHTFLRQKTYSGLNEEIQKELEEYHTKIESNLLTLDLKDTIRALYVFSFFERSFPALVHKLKQDLLDNIPQLDMLLSADDLATASFLVMYLVPEEDSDKGRLLRDLSGHFISRDLLEYDLTLQHYEYDDPTPGETGIKDRLKWGSIALMARVFSQPEYYDDILLNRLKESIYRKSESDLIDFESAAIILSVVSRAKSFKDNDFVMRILEMLNWQFSNEGKEMIVQFDGYTIALFLDAIINLYNSELDPRLINTCFDYFAQLIISQELKIKENKEELEALLRGFKEASKFSKFDQSVFTVLEDKIRDAQLAQ